jgi:hypothetical protein
MAWEYGTYWVAGLLAHQRRYVTGPPPANVGLWPIAPLTHHESEESEEEGGNEGQGAVEGTQGGEGPQGVTAPSGPVMAPPNIAPPVIAPTVPTIGRTGVSALPAFPTPTVAPTPVATPTVPVILAPERPVSTTGAQLTRERPPTTEERHPKRVATEAAATLQGPQLTAKGGPAGPVAGTVSPGGAQADQRWEEAKAEVQPLWALGQQLQTEAQTKPTYTSFRETAKMAQDTFEAAEAVSRQAREERMASVGALPMTGLQLPGAPVVLEPSEQLEADCQNQVQALAVEIVNRGAAARAAGQGVRRPEGETGVSASRGTTQSGTMPPPPVPERAGVSTSTAAGPGPTAGTEGATRGPVTGPSFRPPPGVPRPEPRRPPPSAPLRTVVAPAS